MELICDSARAVVDIARYFAGLQTAAEQLVDGMDPQGRGYFTPVEEEQSLGLLVSYWQTRNALWEVIDTLSEEVSDDSEAWPEALLTAFGAGLLLVDAARFLRETIHPFPLVRAKLNQPAPTFGIPPGVYDTVQRSLVSTRHAWRMYHAIRYFQKEEQTLRGLASRSPLAEVFEIVERLRHRVDVTVADFTKARVRMRSAQARRTVRSVFHQAMYGLQRLSGELMAEKYLRRGHRPRLPDEIATAVQDQLRPGDVLVVRKEYALTNYFLPGYWPHAALYLGAASDLVDLGISDHENVVSRWSQLADDDNAPRVLESQKDGVRIRPMASPFGSDSIVVLRPQMSAPQIAAGLARGIAHEGKGYDFDFDFRRSDRLVCTEVVYRSFDGMGEFEIPQKRTKY